MEAIKLILRIFIVIITSPLWIVLGAIMAVVCIPILIGTFLIACIEYGFTREWNWL